MAIHDTGSGMSSESVETLFCELEQVSNSGYMRNPKYGKDAAGGTESVLGLGLALVARIVRNMNGQLSLKSEQGKGSCFKIRLNFPLPETASQETSQEASKKDSASGEACNTQGPNGARQEDQIPCQGKSDGEQKPNEGVGSEGRQFRCGDEPFTSDTFLNVDTWLESGESRSLTLPHHKQNAQSSPKLDSNTSTKPPTDPKHDNPSAEMPPASKLRVLVAEDDPINSTIIQKRLEKLGYSVRLTTNGKECASLYFEWPHSFDAILMDLQV
jgi:CheY-like chemotaxis protein